MNSGVYKIENKITGDTYIGSTINLKRRYTDHISKLNKMVHPNKYLQEAWSVYGRDNFLFDVLELCEKDNLKKKEQQYIDTLNPTYNICPLSESSKGRPLSENTRVLFSNHMKGRKHALGLKQRKDTIKIRANKLKGKDKTDQTKRIIGEKNAKYIRTDQHRLMLRENSTHKKPVLMLDKITGNIIQEFVSINVAKEFLGRTSHAPIQRCCVGNRETAFGYKWKYKHDKQAIIVKDINGNPIGEFSSFSEIQRELKRGRTYIKRCFDLKVPDYDNLMYEYKYAI